MRTLLVAPKTDLYYAEVEVRKVEQYLNPYILEGDNVTSTRFLETLLRSKYDLIWMATHGSKDGFFLSDGLISSSRFASDVKASGATDLFLNTCESFQTAVLINNNLAVNLICTVKEVPDLEAFETGLRLAYHLSQDLPFDESFELSKPVDNKFYLFLPARFKMRKRDRIGMDDSRLILKKEEDLQEDIKRLIILVEGDKRFNVKGILPMITDLDNRIVKAENRLSLVTTALISLTAVNIMMLIALIVTLIQTWR